MTGFLLGAVAATALYAWQPAWPGKVRSGMLWVLTKTGLYHGAP